MTGGASRREWGEQRRSLELLQSNQQVRFRWWMGFGVLAWLLALTIANPASAAPSLVLPSFVLEGDGVRANAGNFRLGATATSNVLVSLSSTDPALVFVPDTVTVTNGQTNVTFNVTVGDNSVVANSQPVTITASAPGFGTVSNTFQVWENDAHRIRFGLPVSWVQTTNTGWGILMTAEDAVGNHLTNFYGSVEFSAMGLEGVLPLDPTNSGGFAGGQRYLTFTVLAPGRAVRIYSSPIPGESDPFNVGLPPFVMSPQPVTDIAWHEASQTLFATVPANGGVYSNRIVAINPATGNVTNSYPLGGINAGQIELSPGANWLYVALSNETALQRFDINTRTAGLKYSLGTNSEPIRFAYDFCVVPGLADSVVVETQDRDSGGNTYRAGVKRYDSGVPVSLPNFDAAGGWLLESMPSGSQVLISPYFAKGNAATGTILATATNDTPRIVKYLDGFIYDEAGGIYAAGPLHWLGSYPGVLDQFYHTALPEVNSAQRRMFYLAGYFNFGSSFYKLKVYDRDLRQPLLQFTVPSSLGSPTRFVRCGSNGLAYATANRELWLIRSDLIQPNTAPADLQLSVIPTTTTAVVGADYSLTLTLSNAGPGVASVVRVTNTLPSNVAVLATVTSTGSVAVANAGFTWTLGPLPAGSSATMGVTLRFSNAGWQTNFTCALGFEVDPLPANNVVHFPLYVELPPTGPGVFTINAASEDVLYDPVRDRLLLSVGTGTSGQNNGITVFDPYHGLVDSFTPLTQRPSRLARSDDGQFLYVSLPTDALVRRLTLNNLVQNLEFALGGEDINGTWYPFYAADMATVPGNPNALVAWRVRRAGPMADEYGHGIAWFDNGTMRPTTTPPSGNWRVEFDTNAGTLFGYNNGDLRRCSVNALGVSFVEASPQFYSAGDDIEYAAGQLFGTAGRLVEYEPFRVAWVVAGAQTAALVEPDASANRLYFLVQTNGWQINVHELDTLRWLGSIPVPNVLGTPSSLIRWGTNGLAFRTSSNQLHVIRSPLTQPESSAAIVMQFAGPAAPVQPGEDVVLTLMLTNQGPATAVDLQITNLFSPLINIVAVAPTTGSWSTNAGQVMWSVPSLDAGASAALLCTVRSGSIGVYTVTASAVTPTPDPILGDNTAAFVLSIGPVAQQENVAVLRIAVNDLVWSPGLGRLLLTASNSTPNWYGGLLSIEPLTRAVRFESTLGGDAGRLAISTDQERLYAGADFGLNTLTLPALAVTNRFLINPTDPRGRLYDLKILPGNNASVLVGSRSLNNNSTWLGVYDDGIQRTNVQNFFTTGFSLELGADPALCYYQDHSAGGFRRYAIQTNGLTLLDTDAALLPASTTHTLAWADGHIFSSVGILIDPFTRTRVGSAVAITNNSAVCYDAAAGRAYYVSPLGSTAVLYAIDKATLVATGSRVIPGIIGQATSLVRWGTNGLAFRTTAGRLAILQTELVPSSPPADLALKMDELQPLGIVGSNFVYAITVTNAGPNAAPNGQVLFRISTNASVTAASTSVGTLVTNNTQLVANFGTLAAGSQATVTVTIVPAQPGTLLAVASVTSNALDPNRTDNAQSLTNAAALVLAPGATTILAQTANDLAYNPTNGRLYVSGAAGGISVINPALALVEANWPMPSAPTRLTLSENAQFLYALFDAGRRVGRFTTSNGAFGLDFSLGTNVNTPFILLDFAVVPGAAQSLAVTKQASGTRSLQILDDGVLRPGVQLPAVPVNHLEFGSNPTLLYGTSLRQFVIGSTNLVEQGSAIAAVGSENFEFAADYFYSTGGKRIEAASRVILGTYAGLGTGTLVEPDIVNHRVFFLTRVGSTWQVRAYEPATFAFLGSTTVNNVLGNPTNFVRWGADGLAFCTTSNQVFLMRSPLVPAGETADLSLTQTASPGPYFVGSNITFTITVTNGGPNPATNIVLLNRFSTNTTIVSVTNSQGSVTQAAGLVSTSLGTLTNGTSALVRITLRPLRAGNFSNLGVVVGAASDPVSENNSATVSVPVQFSLGPDSFGVVDLPTADLAYDAVSGLLYATPTNQPGELASSVLTINPATGLIGTPLPVTNDLSQLVISDDGTRLYVLANGGKEFHRLSLPSGNPELNVRFSAVTQNTNSYATDLEAVPAQAESLAVVLQAPGILGGGPTVAILDNAAVRPAVVQYQRVIEFYATNFLMSYEPQTVPSSSTRIELTTTGVVQRAYTHYLVDGEMVDGGGLIYTSGGSVIDPAALSKVGNFGVYGLAAPDSTANRLAILGDGSTTRPLHIFDQQTRAQLGALTLTNVLGTATRLLRCGNDRLAFRTSGGQVFVVRTSLLPSGPKADLAVTQSEQPNPVFVGSNLTYTVVVTNHGPHPATNVIVSDSLPPSATFVSANATSGALSNAGNTVTWRLNVLTNGGAESLTITVVPTRLTVLTNVVGVGSSATDSAPANNSIALLTGVSYLAAPNTVQEIQLTARDMVYDPVTRRIYASGAGLLGGGGSSIYPVNPETGVIEPTILVGDNPGRLAVSDNGRYLHVGLNGSSAVRRVDLQTRTADLLFPIGQTMDVQDIVALPGNPTAVAVSRRWLAGSPEFRGVVVYDNGVARSNTISSHTGPNMIEPSASGSVLYGYNPSDSEGGFYRMSINEGGVSLLDMTVGLVPAFNGDILHNGSRIYTTDGLAINPNTLTSIGSFANVPHVSPVAADSDSQKVFYAVATNSDWVVRAYRSDTFAAVADIPLTNVLGSPTHLVRCGADRLALLTSGGQLFLIRTSLLPAADVVLFGGFATNQVMAGTPVNLQLIVSNGGPYSVSSVTLTNLLPAGLDILSLALSQGSAITNGQTVVAQLGSLATNTAAVLSFVLSPTTQAIGWTTNFAQASGSSPDDPIQFNNRSALSLRVTELDTDGDGMPDDWEIAYGLNPTNAIDGPLDSDCDGLTNLQEYQAASHPRQFEAIQLHSAQLVGPGLFETRVIAAVGKTYTLEGTTNLVNWKSLDSFVCREPNQIVQVAVPPSATRYFFRLRGDTNAPLPLLTLINVPSPPTNWPQIRVNATPGRFYSLQVSSNLTQWTTITNYFGLECSTVITDTGLNQTGARFYRLLLP